MAIGLGEHPEERGLSARHLVLLFLAGVAVCGVFFSLGFLVGFNERFSRSTPATERITTPSAIPPTVNPPEEDVSITPKESAAGHSPLNAGPDAASSPPAGVQAGPSETKLKSATIPSAASQRASHASAPTKSEVSRPTAPAATRADPGEGIMLQVAALRARQDADALVNILKGRGYPVFLVTPEHAHADDNLFRVQVGPYKTHDEAEKARSKLSQEGFKPFVRH